MFTGELFLSFSSELDFSENCYSFECVIVCIGIFSENCFEYYCIFINQLCLIEGHRVITYLTESDSLELEVHTFTGLKHKSSKVSEIDILEDLWK